MESDVGNAVILISERTSSFQPVHSTPVALRNRSQRESGKEVRRKAMYLCLAMSASGGTGFYSMKLRGRDLSELPILNVGKITGCLID